VSNSITRDIFSNPHANPYGYGDRNSHSYHAAEPDPIRNAVP
jgi:hypothetical protein